MDIAEDNSYLTLLNVGDTNYLLQSGEHSLGIQDHPLNETSFDSVNNRTWNNDVPDLMNGDLILEDNIRNTVGDLPNFYENSLNEDNIVLSNVNSAKENNVTYPVNVTNKDYVTSEGLFIANDLLLHLNNDNRNNQDNENNSKISDNIGNSQLNLNASEVLITSESLVIKNNGTNETKIDLPGGELSSSNFIKILNSNQNIINVDENLLNLNTHIEPITVSKSKIAEYEATIKDNNQRYDLISAYKCKACSYICENRDNMDDHWQKTHFSLEIKNNVTNSANAEIQNLPITINNSDNQTIYLCSECKYGFSSIEKLKNHMVVAHKLIGTLEQVNKITNRPPDSNIVSQKPSVSKQKIAVALIQKQSKASKKIKCSIKGCDLRFAMDEMRIRHEKCHVEGQKKQFICYECNMKFFLWRICSMHMWKCHKVDLGLYTCQMCSIFKASSPARLASHMLNHNNDKPYICPTCNKSFKFHAQLQNHQLTHVQPGEEVPLWALQQQCHICKKFFANSKSLKKHIVSIHDKFKPFVCNVCGHKTTRKAMLVLHLRQHTGEKPHKCKICNYRTGDHNSLRRHIMRHSGEVKYSCPHCSYQSIQSTSYKNHIASKHPGLGGSYFCSLCSFHTVNEVSYSNHLTDHKNGMIMESNNDEQNVIKLPTTSTSGVNVNNVNDINNKKIVKISKLANEEPHEYLLMLDHSNEVIDKGGITIPANFDTPS